MLADIVIYIDFAAINFDICGVFEFIFFRKEFATCRGQG